MDISEKQQKLLSVLNEYHSLGIPEQIDYQKFYLYSIITHSTAIEGSSVTELDNRLLFDDGITAKSRSLQEQMMNLDLKSAYEYSMRLAKEHTDLSIEFLQMLSGHVMKNTGCEYHTALGAFDAAKGDLRLVNVTAGAGGRSYMNFTKVPAKLSEYCQQINERRRLLIKAPDVIEQYLLSFDAHYYLVVIHPWVDGNGRMSRLMMNHLQYEFGLVPSKILKEDKAEYIQSLMDSQEQESVLPFQNFMLTEHIKNLENEIRTYKQTIQHDPLEY